MRKERKITLSISATILPLVIIVSYVLSSAPFSGFTDAPAKVDIKTMTVWHIGISNSLLDTALSKMQQLGVTQIKRLAAQEPLSNRTLEALSFNDTSMVVFDGDWISTRGHNLDIQRLLIVSSGEGAKLVVVKGLTSKLFEVLDEAGVHKLGRDVNGNLRNPVQFNPPIAGWMMKQASTPDGQSYFFPSIFASNTTDTDTMVQELVNWLGG